MLPFVQDAKAKILEKAAAEGVQDYLPKDLSKNIFKEWSRQQRYKDLADQGVVVKRPIRFTPNSPGSPVSIAKRKKREAIKMEELEECRREADEAFEEYRQKQLEVRRRARSLSVIEAQRVPKINSWMQDFDEVNRDLGSHGGHVRSHSVKRLQGEIN